MKEHKLICTTSEVGKVMDNLMQHNANDVRAKQIDGLRYLVTWETEDENDDRA